MSLSNIKQMKKDRGFTIVELLIVIVVIGILAAIVIVAYNGVSQRAKTSKAQSAGNTVIKKAEAYNAETGAYPTTFGAMTGAASSASYYVAAGSIVFATTAVSAPANESTVNYSTCVTPAGIRVSYWDYASSPAAISHLYSGGATAASTCTIATT